MQLIIEAVAVGMLIVIIGYLLEYLSSINNHFNELYNSSLLVKLFICGSLTHLLFEYFGFNRWYCKNGFACK